MINVVRRSAHVSTRFDTVRSDDDGVLTASKIKSYYLTGSNEFSSKQPIFDPVKLFQNLIAHIW